MTSSAAPYARVSPEGVMLTVTVAPRAKNTKYIGLHAGLPKIALAAPPIEGRANDELV